MLTTKNFVHAVIAALLVLAILISTFPTQAETNGPCFSGFRKGLTRDAQGLHHYVDFTVNVSVPDSMWFLVSSPLPLPYGRDTMELVINVLAIAGLGIGGGPSQQALGRST